MRNLKRIQASDDFPASYPFPGSRNLCFAKIEKLIDLLVSLSRSASARISRFVGIVPAHIAMNCHVSPARIRTSVKYQSAKAYDILPIRTLLDRLLRQNTRRMIDSFASFTSTGCSVLLISFANVTRNTPGKSEPGDGIGERFADRAWLQSQLSQTS
jgi:hypothetical protein